jgi:hypothetical protein
MESNGKQEENIRDILKLKVYIIRSFVVSKN